jgi:hypothetical protein
MQWKKVNPKDVRGYVDKNLSDKNNRKENRYLRKRIARRIRHIDKDSIKDEIEKYENGDD